MNVRPRKGYETTNDRRSLSVAFRAASHCTVSAMPVGDACQPTVATLAITSCLMTEVRSCTDVTTLSNHPC